MSLVPANIILVDSFLRLKVCERTSEGSPVTLPKQHSHTTTKTHRCCHR